MTRRAPRPREPQVPTPAPVSHDGLLRTILAKARANTGRSIDLPSAIQDIATTEQSWAAAGAIAAPYDPESLLAYVELCSHLSPNIDAYAQNIEGFGYEAVPSAEWMRDLETPGATAALQQALEIERWRDAMVTNTAVVPVGPGEVDAAREKLRSALHREKYLFDAWFAHCCSDMSFTELRKNVRWEREAAGWGCMEMIRDDGGTLKRLSYVPGYTVRPLLLHEDEVEVMEPDPITPISEGRAIRVRRTFRRYAQIVQDKTVYFKSPGDPRVVSRATGKPYESLRDLQAAEEGVEPANELLWFGRFSPKTPCAPPRWVPALLSVLGSREADEVNYYYFNNKSIPPAIVFVSGGRIPKDVRDRLESRIHTELHGASNFHKVLVVEAMPIRMQAMSNDRTMLPQIHYQELGNQQKDGLFLDYDARAADRIGATFRQAPLLRGYTPSNLNRATAEAVIKFTEAQVYQPEREAFDWTINTTILPLIGIRFLRFRSMGPVTRAPQDLADFVKVVAPYGGLVPQEIRQITAEALNLHLERIDEAWARQPMPMTLAGLRQGDGNAMDTPADNVAPLRTDEDTLERIKPMEIAHAAADIVREELENAGLRDLKVYTRR